MRKDDAKRYAFSVRPSMYLEWFHAVLAVFMLGMWLLVGQIVATDRK